MEKASADQSNTIRGALRVTVSTSEPIVDASGDFSIFVVIENPFDVPITVYSVQTHIPVELVDTVWVQKYLLSRRAERINAIRSARGWKKIGVICRHRFEQIFERLRAPVSPRIAEAVGTEVTIVIPPVTPSPSTLRIEGDATNSTILVGAFSELWHLRFPENPSNEELDRLFMKIEDYRSGKTPVILQPGDSVVKQFVLRAKHWLFFRPISYNFQIQIRYAVDGKEHLDTVPFNLQIRAALTATILGSIIGSLIGTVARVLGKGGGELSIGVFVLAAILGSITVVAFARKENAQTIISVEDFWGGMLIGFLVGYIGESFFREIVGVK